MQFGPLKPCLKSQILVEYGDGVYETSCLFTDADILLTIENSSEVLSRLIENLRDDLEMYEMEADSGVFISTLEISIEFEIINSV